MGKVEKEEKAAFSKRKREVEKQYKAIMCRSNFFFFFFCVKNIII